MVPNRSVVEDQELQILRSTATETIAIRETFNESNHPGGQGAPVMCPADLAPSVLKAAKSLPTSAKSAGNRWRTICKLLTDCCFSTNKCLYALNILNSRHNGMNLKGKEVQFSLGTSMLLMSPPAFVKWRKHESLPPAADDTLKRLIYLQGWRESVNLTRSSV